MTNTICGEWTGRWRRLALGGALVVLASGFTGQRPASGTAVTAAAATDPTPVTNPAPVTDPVVATDPAAATDLGYAGSVEATFVAAESAEGLDDPRATGVRVAMVDETVTSDLPILPEAASTAPDTHPEPFGAMPADAVAERVRRVFPTAGSRLAWRGVHGGVDGALWRRERAASSEPDRAAGARIVPLALHDVGFPSIELVESLPPERRRWRRMVSWHESAATPGRHEPIPHVRCMGLKPAAVARRAARFEPLVIEYSIEYGVSASLVKALISVESCFDPKAVSHVGAIGLMQLMPATAAWLKAGDPWDVRNNLRAGIRYLASLREMFGEERLALAAYNAGPGNVRRYGGIPPFAETRGYVAKVLSHRRRYAAATALAAR